MREYHALFDVNVGEAFLVKLEGDGSGSSVNFYLRSDLIRITETVVRSDRVSKPRKLRYTEKVRNSLLVEPTFE